MIFCVIPVLLFAAEMFLRGRIREGINKDTVPSCKNVRIVPAENRGFAGNNLEKHPKLVKTVAAASFAVYAILYPFVLLSKETALFKVGMSMILGGAAGNTFERLRYGYVTDYLQFRRGQNTSSRGKSASSVGKKRPKRTMIWNLADLAILSGTAVLLLGHCLKKLLTHL